MSPAEDGALADLLRFLKAEEAERRRDDLHRELLALRGVDFSSNDYLGLSHHPRLAEAMREALAFLPSGAAASRLLSGHLAAHEEVEARLAAWKGTEAALLFPSGYAANLGVLGALVRREDRALSDSLNHASIIDGLKLSGCRRQVYPHLDLEALKALLEEPHAGGRTFIVTETLFSMEGDVAPLSRLAALADRHGALLVLDDAHATGLHGERGSGLAEELGVTRRAAAIVSTCGKALGLWGAFAAGPHEVIDCLINRARAFIFTTAVPPVLAAAIGAALEIVEGEPQLRRQLVERTAQLRRALRSRGIGVAAEGGPIVPVILGEDHRALAVAREARARGYDVRAIRAPSVPPGTARLRLSVHADRTPAEVDGLAEALAAALAAASPETASRRPPA